MICYVTDKRCKTRAQAPALIKLIVIVSSSGLSQTTSSPSTHLKPLFIDSCTHPSISPSSITSR